MLRTQAKKQSSFYVCTSCRRQHHNDLAQLRSRSRIRTYHLSTTTRSSTPAALTVSKLPTSSGSRVGAAHSRHGALAKISRIGARSFTGWGRFGAQDIPGQSNAAWGAAPKTTPTSPAKPGPASPAWGTLGTLPPATGTSAWGGSSKVPPSTTPPSAWGGGNKPSPGPARSPWGGAGAQGPGPSAWGGLGSAANGSAPPPWVASPSAPPSPAPAKAKAAPSSQQTTPTGTTPSGPMEPAVMQRQSKSPAQLTPPAGARAKPASFIPPLLTRGPRPFTPRPTESPPVQTSASDDQSAAPTWPPAPHGQLGKPLAAKTSPGQERNSGDVFVAPQIPNTASSIPSQSSSNLGSSPPLDNVHPTKPATLKVASAPGPDSSSLNQSSTPGSSREGFSKPAFGVPSRSTENSSSSYAGKSAFGVMPKSFGSPSGPVAGKPAFGISTGFFGGPSASAAGKATPGGAPGWTPGKPAFGGAQDWASKASWNAPSPSTKDGSSLSASNPGHRTVQPDTAPDRTSGRPAFGGAQNWMPKTTLSTSSPSTNASPPRHDPGFPVVQGHSTRNAAQWSSDAQLQRRSRPQTPAWESKFVKPPVRKPEPGAEFPQLPRKTPRMELFESMSPFKLPPKSPFRNVLSDASPGSPPETVTPRLSDAPAGSVPKTVTPTAPSSAPDHRHKDDNYGFGINSSSATTATRSAMTSDAFAEAMGSSPKPTDDWGDRQTLGESRRQTSQDRNQTAASAALEFNRKTKDRGARRGIDTESREDIYAARDRARKGKKSGGLRKQHTQYDEDAEEYDGYNDKIRRQQRRQALEEQRAAEEAAAGPKKISLPEYITVYDLAVALQIKPAAFLQDLEQLGFENTLQDTFMTGETAALVAAEYGFDPTVESGVDIDLRPRPPPEDFSSVPPRPPIVTIMGHVDHGKTTILDTMRKSSVVSQEFGGITQHIGAFSVKLSRGKVITFLDTPGHAAFLSMRQRGANVTDIVVLVVAVDDSVKPQTIEAIKHAQNAKVPMIVAINKVDIDDTPNRLDIVKQDLANNGVEIEDYGGDVQAVAISGKTGRGMRDLEDAILTLSEVLDMRAEIDGMAEGWVLEASVKTDGRAATILVKRGTLRVGDLIVAGTAYTRIRIMRNEGGMDVEEAGPGTPVEIYGGWKGEPMAGDMILQAPDETKAQAAVDYRQEIADRAIAAAQNAERERLDREKVEREALKKEMEEAEAAGEDVSAEAEPVVVGPKVVSIIVKGDVAGSVEAVTMAIQEIGNNEVQPRILHSSPGQVTESDVDHMATARGAIVTFNSPVASHILHRAEKAGIVILEHNIIYETVQAVKDLLSAQLSPIYSQRVVAEATVQQIFPINVTKRKYKNIAGSKVTSNKITRGGKYRVMRDGEEIHKGKLSALKQEKKDVTEVRNGIECGIMFEDFDQFEEGDRIQLYEDVEQKRYL